MSNRLFKVTFIKKCLDEEDKANHEDEALKMTTILNLCLIIWLELMDILLVWFFAEDTSLTILEDAKGCTLELADFTLDEQRAHFAYIKDGNKLKKNGDTKYNKKRSRHTKKYRKRQKESKREKHKSQELEKFKKKDPDKSAAKVQQKDKQKG
ncbi:hypothetical protein K501DRAFT_276472 [Backusella circina FSU 941]|nr:hypothetical protein K501DRAFT_276472 [Backusella circina FSU 941]